jgi:hypothetical protein
MNSRLRNIDNYANINDTWTPASSLSRSEGWKQNITENYRGSSYNTITSGWTIQGNITPENSPINNFAGINYGNTSGCDSNYYSY